MPYKIVSELPPPVKDNLPTHAQEIFMAAYNSAWEKHGKEDKAELTCNSIAWAAVENKYSKNDKGDWVAKESNMSAKTDLQTKYAQLIQEVGRKHAAADEQRIKQIINLCNELLQGQDDNSQESARFTEALKECDSCLTWLKEQAVEKDGMPAEAFAYVPDKEKTSTWKLPLWEDGKVTRAKLGMAAAALSPGGFRGQKADIPEADLPTVKRRIRTEYTKLGVSDDDIPKWVKESESRQFLADYQPLTEANYKNGEATITIIKPGFNAGKGRFYPKETLSRDFGIFEGAKMYADHPTPGEEKDRPERSIRDWVATLGKPFVETDGSIKAKAVIVEPWLKEKLATLRDNGLLKEMGVSINAIGSASDATIEGVKTKLIEHLIRARSVDFVTEPGAGGTVNVFESVDPNVDIDLIDVAQIKERRPDIIRLLEAEIEAKNKQEANKKMALEEEVTKLTESNQTLTKENGELKTQIAEVAKAKAKAEAQALIKEAVNKAQLPEAAKTKLLEQFKEAEKTDGIDAAIKAESDYIAKLKESGKPRGMGSTASGYPGKSHQELVETFMATGMSKEKAEIAATGR